MSKELKAWLRMHGVDTPEQATGRPVCADYIASQFVSLGFCYERESNTVQIWSCTGNIISNSTRFNLDDLRRWVAAHGKITPENFDAAIIGAKGWAV